MRPIIASYVLAPLCLCALTIGPAFADAPVIEAARAVQGSAGWQVDVTLRHPDSGWDHYADGWEVLAPDGTSLGLRVLLHPHETEQPFTRSLAWVVIPEGADHVTIRARCLVDGWAAATYRIDLR